VPAVNPVRFDGESVQTNSALSPRAALMLFPSETSTIFASYSRAFRAPSPEELYFLYSGVIARSEHLSPETVDSGELGLKQKFGLHSLLASVFASRWNGMNALLATGQLQHYGTVGDIINYGANLGLEGTFLDTRVHYGLSVTYGYARRTGIDQAPLSSYPAAVSGSVEQALAQRKTHPELIASPEIFGNARLSYDFQGDAPEIALVAAVYGPRLTTFAYSSTLNLPAASAMGAASSVDVPGATWRSNINPMFTDTMLELRLNVSGNIPLLPALRYHIMANYLASPAFEANAFGPLPGRTVPTSAAVPGITDPPKANGQLFPATRLTLAAGLEVAFD
jgi:outer membrane receptor protein involved in Fe transport